MASSPEKVPQNENSVINTQTTHSTSASTPNNSMFQNLSPLTIKLDRANYSFWRSQVIPALRAHDLEGYVLGTEICPSQFTDHISSDVSSKQVNSAFTLWIRMDQAIMSWLLNSISESMFGHIVRCNTSHEVWHTLENLFTTHSKARTLQLRFQLQSLKKGNLSIHDYMLKMRSLSETLASAGQLISDDELTLYILGGLGHDYDSVVVNLTSRHDQVTLQEVQYMLQSQEMRLEQLNLSTPSDTYTPNANLATHFRKSLNLQGFNNTFSNTPRNFANDRGNGKGKWGRGNRPHCQLCNRPGHIAFKCYHRFDISFQGQQSSNPHHSKNPFSGQPQLKNNHQAYFSTSNAANPDNAWYRQWSHKPYHCRPCQHASQIRVQR